MKLSLGTQMGKPVNGGILAYAKGVATSLCLDLMLAGFHPVNGDIHFKFSAVGRLHVHLPDMNIVPIDAVGAETTPAAVTGKSLTFVNKKPPNSWRTGKVVLTKSGICKPLSTGDG